MNAASGPVTGFIDDSLVFPLPVVAPAGTWVLPPYLSLIGATNNTNQFATLEFAQNSKIVFSFLSIATLEIQSVSTAVVATIASGIANLFTNQASINALAPNTQAFFEITNGAILSVTQQGGNLGDNVHNLFNVDVGGTFVYLGYGGADLERSAVGGSGAAAGASGSYTSDCITHANTQSGTWTQASLASNEGYGATTPANWSNNNPSSVANALDRLAAKVGPVP